MVNLLRCPAALLTLLGLILFNGVTWSTKSHGEEPAVQTEEEAARELEIKALVSLVRRAGFYGLRDPQEKAAIEKLREMSQHAAPHIAVMLAEGRQNRKEGWIQVYRPLYILRGMGEHSMVALPDIIAALDDNHGAVRGAAVLVLEDIGPAAKEALPALHAAQADPKNTQFNSKLIAAAIRKIDPEAAEKKEK